MPSPQNREEMLIALALEKPADLRPAFLDAVCAGDPALRQRLEALLAAHQKADELPPSDASAARVTIELDLPDAEDEAVGKTIGRYKVLEKVGEGGCGVVYVAEQTEPVRRRVALKVIKLGMDTKEVIARFEAERQALAMMDHPNIAKVLDAGATEAGRPFFVMELVRGIKITEYCDQNHLTTKERLDLFIKVSQAIQHAHQKGIIHRDIKPSNILVTMHDGVPVPKVIDFGIAKATVGQTLTDKTLYTQLRQFIGTPAYVSPEQVEMSGLDIDTRSDIYSLGVLLYELLAGSTPFDAKELMSQGIDAMRKTIREKEPVRPSTRLATLKGEELTTTAKRRSADTSKLLHQLKGDLDWIVMKCLEKDRTRRYETANGLAADLKRHLNNEPVLARPPSNAYRFQKWVRRNKVAFATATLIVSVLLTATGISLWQAFRATRAETLAKRAEYLATQRLEDSEAISKFLTEVFRSPDPRRDGRTITVAETLGAAAKKLDTDLANQPARRAKLQDSVARTYWALGLYREAIPLQEKVRDYYQGAFGSEDSNTLGAMLILAVSCEHADQLEEALELREHVLMTRRKVLGLKNPKTLEAMQALSYSYDKAGRRDDALQLREEGLSLHRKVLGPEHLDTLRAMIDLAHSYGEAGRKDEALKLREEALALRRKLLGPEHPDTLMAMNDMAISYDDVGRPEEAIKLLEPVQAWCLRMLGPEHPYTLWAMQGLSDSYDEAGRGDEALKLREQVLALRRKVLGSDHADTIGAMDELAISYDEAGRGDEALKLWNEMLPLCRKLLGPGQAQVLDEMNDMAWALATSKTPTLRNGTNAVQLAEEVVAKTTRKNAFFLDTLAAAYAETQQFDKAVAVEQEAMSLLHSEVDRNDYASRLQLYQAKSPCRSRRHP
jgi:serine/threonine protein kinase